MKSDSRFASTRAALHDCRCINGSGDDPVLVGLNRRHDVAHLGGSFTPQLLEENVADSGLSCGRNTERLVRDTEEPFLLSAKRRRRVSPAGSAGVAV